jgi:ATP phosphoribosyltransferase regulatory subunit HisZ
MTDARQRTYPLGVRPILADEAARRRAIESRIVGELERQSFREIILPIIDFVEPYEDVLDRDVQRRSYRFTDREGDLVSVRSDFTPMIARAIAPSLRTEDLPMRLFYRGDVIRCEATRLGATRELFQIGAELIGPNSIESDVEILTLAARLLSAAGIRPVVTFSDVRIAERLIESAVRGDDQRRALRSALSDRRPADLRLSPTADAEPAGLLRRTATGTATLDDFASYPPTAEAAERLKAIESALRSSTAAEFLATPDDIDEAGGYYSGLRFRLFTPHSRVLVAQGGRYDGLYRRFGTDAPATGFTLTVDHLDAERSDPRSARGDQP